MMMILMIPILVVLSAKDIKQGDVIHRLQQPLPSLLLQVTDIGQKLVVGKALAPMVLPVGPVHEMHDSDEHPWKALLPNDDDDYDDDNSISTENKNGSTNN